MVNRRRIRWRQNRLHNAFARQDHLRQCDRRSDTQGVRRIGSQCQPCRGGTGTSVCCGRIPCRTWKRSVSVRPSWGVPRTWRISVHSAKCRFGNHQGQRRSKVIQSIRTPGPWRYDGSWDWGVVKAGTFQICQAREPVSACSEEIKAECRREGKDPWEANARLIAKSPQLLEALEELVDFSSPIGFGRDCQRSIAAFQNARAIISEAKGETK
jgi:hypothetical protein